MKTVEVVAAVIVDGAGRTLATQRGYGNMKDGWEFPGEIAEELAVTVEVGDKLYTVDWDYPDFHLTMHCYRCRVVDGKLALLEHEASRWLSPSELWTVDWLPADRQVVEHLTT